MWRVVSFILLFKFFYILKLDLVLFLRDLWVNKGRGENKLLGDWRFYDFDNL